ncbi:MAG: lysine--tRNA ligase [Mailhella sp.]|nr:lysine--tRNA ligase [Mailhella sp.]
MLENFADHGELNEVVKNCVGKACDLLDSGVSLYPNDFRREHEAALVHAEYEACTDDELQALGMTFSLAGRMMSSRSFGKVIFFHLMDRSGTLQCYAEKAVLGEEAFASFKTLDVGDIVGVTGGLFRTKTGELTLRCDTVRLLSKSFRALPDKHSGLTDVESRYRQRYVDLIMNPRARDIFRKRSRIVREFRRFMEQKGFMEVETPMMHAIAGGATARPFVTHHNALNMDLYMRIAPELYLKRLIVGGMERVFEINRCFRNEGIDTRHNPEFTTCEFYWAYATYEDLMDLTEQLFAHIAREVCGSTIVSYQGKEIDLTPGHWTRMSYHEALEKIGGHSPEFYNDMEAVRAYLREHGERYMESEGIGKLQSRLFDLDVEEKLVQPSFIYAYPAEISPLARRNDENPEITDRFEFFICGCEYGNAFSELNDPVDQRLRFEAQVEAKANGDEEACPLDNDYLRALEFGMPPTAGEGIGIDRLTMLLTDEPSIREVLLFPLLRSEA